MKQRWAQSSRFEKALSRLYPFGVSKKLQVQPSKCSVLFIAEAPEISVTAANPFAGAQGELLYKAVTQGLRWNIERADLIYASLDTKEAKALKSANKQEARARLDSEINARKPHTIVALGNTVSQILELGEIGAVAKGWQEREGQLFYATTDLARVLSDAATKKSFWLDLKEIAARIDKDVQ